MKKIILSVFLLSTFMLAQENVIVKKFVKSGGEGEKEIEVLISDDNLQIEVESDGEEQVYNVDLKNKKELQELLLNLKEQGIDVNLLERPDKPVPPHNRGYLGVGLTDLTPQLGDYFGVKKGGGVLINNVTKDSPADKAGLKAGDVVIKAGDRKIGDSAELSRFVKRQGPGAKVDLTILRKSRQRKIEVTLGTFEGHDTFIAKGPRAFEWRGEDDLGQMFFMRSGDRMPGKQNIKVRKMRKMLDEDLQKEMEILKKEMEALKKELKDIKE